MHPLVLTRSEVVPFGAYSEADDDAPPPTPVLTTDALAHAVLSRPLKRLTWTNYADAAEGDFERGVKLYEEVVAPLLARVGQDLEVLQVVGCVEGVGMGRNDRAGWGVGGDTERELRRRKSRNPIPLGIGQSPSAALLTEMTAEYTTTQRFVSLEINDTATDLLPPPTLSLPSLRSLKATLSNSTFHVLSTWSMPILRNLSVISADFGYAAEGFRRFFEVHGAKIEQLELGHSSGEIEEFWITEPPPPAAPAANNNGLAHPRFQIPLDAWCPNLLEFICSADAEWNWQSPDWIAPHVLLPAHTGLRFIGVRDMERRLVGDADEAMRRERYGNANHQEEPYFMLLEQFGSLLRKEAFPSLLYVRDMSVESDVMRRSGRMGGPPSPFTSNVSVSTPVASSSLLKPRKLLSRSSQAHLSTLEVPHLLSLEDELALAQGQRVLRFWMAVLERCRVRGVWLEDWRGVNITMGELKRTSVVGNSVNMFGGYA